MGKSVLDLYALCETPEEAILTVGAEASPPRILTDYGK